MKIGKLFHFVLNFQYFLYFQIIFQHANSLKLLFYFNSVTKFHLKGISNAKKFMFEKNCLHFHLDTLTLNFNFILGL